MQEISEGRGNRFIVRTVEPVAYRTLAVLVYMSGFLGVPFLPALAVWAVYPRSRFLRSHALNALLIHGLAFVIVTAFGAWNLFFLVEGENAFLSWRSRFGEMFRNGGPVPIFFLIAQSGLFLFVSFFLSLSFGKRLPAHVSARAAVISVLGVPIFFYSSLLWGVPKLEDIIYWGRFIEPTEMFPGHLSLLFSFYLSILAGSGYRFRLPLLDSLYAKLNREERSIGAKRNSGARWRSLVFPGWGLFFLRRRWAGIALASSFLLVVLFLILSFGLVYGKAVEETPGLNPNFTWYLLSDLGLRPHTSDGDFRALFGNFWALSILSALAAGHILVSWFATRSALRRLEDEALGGAVRRSEFGASLPQSLILHLMVLAVFLVVPINFFTPRSASRQPMEPIRVIPEHFENPESRMQLDGGAVSGNEKPSTDPSGGHRESRPGRGLSGEGQGTGKDSEFGRPGKRRDMTYSNYVSAKIRGPEKWMNYWNRMPHPYSAVFEYVITAEGDVRDVRVLESSGSPESDAMTVEMIRAMGRILPPPGGRDVLVTELFWNTHPGDDELPTDLQRRLSRAFDGRVISEAY